MAKVFLEATMPDVQLKWFLSMIRKWFISRRDVNLQISFEAPELTTKQVKPMMAELQRIWMAEGPELPITVKIDDGA